METKKSLEVLVVEDFDGQEKAFKGFEEDMKTELAKRGYDISLKVCKSYDEYKTLPDPAKYDVVITDMMLPGGRSEIEKIITDTLEDDERYAKAMELDRKYSEHSCVSEDEKKQSYIKDLDKGEFIQVPFIQALKMKKQEKREYFISGTSHGKDFASGLLIAQELKDLGKKPTVYTKAISISGHAMRGRVLLRCLGEELIPFEDILSVAQQEMETSYSAFPKILSPSTGRATIISVSSAGDDCLRKYGGDQIAFCEHGGEKRAAYADALEAAIKYQL